MTSAVLGLPERLVQQALDGHIARIFPQFYVSQLPNILINVRRDEYVMKRSRIGIYGEEGEYVRKLAAYIRRRCSDSLEVKAFTKKEALKECLEEGGVDCMLTESDGEPLCREYRVWTALLSECGEEAKERGGICIEKYQSAEQIWKMLLKFGGERLQGAGTPFTATDAEPVFIGIASPVHGCGKTSLGLFAGRLLAEYERTLFLSLDEFSCLPEILGEGGGVAELSELYYYYSQGELSGIRLQPALCRWGKAEYLVPAGEPEDLYREGKPYEAGFFRALAQAGAYRYVVLDLGNSLFGKEGILGLCKRLYVPEETSPGGLIRMEQFCKWLENRGLSERAVRCRIPWDTGKRHDCSFQLAFLSETGETVQRLLRKDGFLPEEAG